MPIETDIAGDPASIRANADWLRGRLAAALDQTVDDLFAARNAADGGWRGDAGPAFSGRMGNAGRRGDTLRGEAESVASGLHRYADDLATAQAGMERARGIARDAGLELAGTTILEPGPTPATTPLPTDRASTPEMLQAHSSAVAAQEKHQQKVAAYVLAQEEANRSNAVKEAARGILKNMADDARSKPLLLAGDLVNGAIVGGLAERHTSILRAQAKAYVEEAKVAEERYLKARGGTPESLRYNKQFYKGFLDADEYTRRASSVSRRVGSKIPLVGLGITAAGIGYDVHQGKPVGKAVLGGVGGALAAAGTGAAIGSFLGPGGTVVGAVGGALFGAITSGAIDYAYDQLSKETQAAIEDGFNAVGGAVGDASEAIGGGVKKAFDAIF